MKKKYVHIITLISLIILPLVIFTQSTPPQNIWKDTPEELEITTEDQINGNYDLNTTIQQRLKKAQKSIPLDYNEHTQKYINHFISDRRQHFAKVLTRAEKYFPIYESILAKNGVPEELKYLSVVESALNPYAVSPKGATGPWQFMYSTGLGYGLDINKRVDERKDPYEATAAAARFLKYLHGLFGDWLLAIAAYNCGPGGVQKAIKKSGGKTTYWEIRPFLPKETQGYVPSFIATVYMMKYAKLHNIYPNDYDFFVTERVTLNSKLLLSDIEKITALPREILIQENPSLLTTLVPEGYKLSLPKSRVPIFKSFVDSLYLLAEDVNSGDKLLQPTVIKPSSVAKDMSLSSCETPSSEKGIFSKKTSTEKHTSSTEKSYSKSFKEKVKEKVFDKILPKKEETKKFKQDPKKNKDGKSKKNDAKITSSTPLTTNLSNDEIMNQARLRYGLPPNYSSSNNSNDKSDNEDYALLLYTVKDGDNPGFISDWYHCGVNEMKSWNDMSSNLIHIGQELVMYVHKDDFGKFNRFDRFSNRIKDKLSKNIVTHDEKIKYEYAEKEKSFALVKDSIIKIIKDSISKVITPSTAAPGKALEKNTNNKKAAITSETDNSLTKTSDGCYALYTLQSGDNLWTIAKKVNADIEDLKLWNKNLNFNKMKPGQPIKVRKLKNCKY
jgi:membrane-bound lytic murein transglycosylase D